MPLLKPALLSFLRSSLQRAVAVQTSGGAGSRARTWLGAAGAALLLSGCASGIGVGIGIAPGVSINLGLGRGGPSIGLGTGWGPVGAGVSVDGSGRVIGSAGVGAAVGPVGVGIAGSSAVLYEPQAPQPPLPAGVARGVVVPSGMDSAPAAQAWPYPGDREAP